MRAGKRAHASLTSLSFEEFRTATRTVKLSTTLSSSAPALHSPCPPAGLRIPKDWK